MAPGKSVTHDGHGLTVHQVTRAIKSLKERHGARYVDIGKALGAARGGPVPNFFLVKAALCRARKEGAIRQNDQGKWMVNVAHGTRGRTPPRVICASYGRRKGRGRRRGRGKKRKKGKKGGRRRRQKRSRSGRKSGKKGKGKGRRRRGGKKRRGGKRRGRKR